MNLAIRSKTKRVLTPSLFLGLALFPQFSLGQLEPKGFFRDPSLILSTGGHHAPVRALVFAGNGGNRLLSGGLDRSIHTWSLDGDLSRPTRTIRPPLWRGNRGTIYAMALSPVEFEPGQRLLAVGGLGVLSGGGEILLLRYPGLDPLNSGEVVAQLPVQKDPNVFRDGHTLTVNALTFSPDGKFLASTSNDATIRIWDLAARTTTLILQGHVGPVNAVAYSADGTRLVSAGRDGVVRLWDAATAALVKQYDPPVLDAARNELGSAVNALSINPVDGSIVVGRENGEIARLGADPGNQRTLYKPKAQGPIESLATSPDGKRLAVSRVVRDLVQAQDRPDVECLIELRSLPDGAVTEEVRTLSNLSYAVAFSPDGKTLAYAGGDDQAITLRPLNAPGQPGEILKGQGSSLWDVGFHPDSSRIRFSRSRPAQPGQGNEYEEFDLKARRFVDPSEAVWRHAQAADAGWTISPVDPFSLDVVNAQQEGFRIRLSETEDRRWWSYGIIKPGPGHPNPVMAVGCDSGVALFRLTDGIRVRHLVGHSGPVYALADSPDGKLLVTGSSDQTVRLWNLDGCDAPAPLGARFEREADGVWTVAEVTKGGFADGIGLAKGQRVLKFFVGAQQANLEDHVAGLDARTTTELITFDVQQGDSPRARVATQKRNSPLLSLFPSVDHQWILWSPRGYYDTSFEADRKYLGWQTNRGTILNIQAGVFDTADKFEARFRQRKGVLPNVIDTLLATGNVARADALGPQAPPAQLADPTTSKVSALSIQPAGAPATDAPVTVLAPSVPVDVKASVPVDAVPIVSVRIERDGAPVAEVAQNPPSREVSLRQLVALGDIKFSQLTVAVTDALGVVRRRGLTVINTAPPAKPPGQRLFVLALGANKFNVPSLPPILFADRDARDVARFLGASLVSPASQKPFGSDRVIIRAFAGDDAGAGGFLDALAELDRESKSRRLGPGDVVAILIESHYLQGGSLGRLATRDNLPDLTESPCIPAGELSDRLTELRRQGVRTVVFLDAVHGLKTPDGGIDIQEWVRDLQARAGAITFLASGHGPSKTWPDGGHRVFAQGVLDAFDVKSAGRVRPTSPGTLSLFSFQDNVKQSVLTRTGRRQFAQCAIPETVAPSTVFLSK